MAMYTLKPDRKLPTREPNFADWEAELEHTPAYRDHYRLTVATLFLLAIVGLFSFFSFERRGYHFDAPRQNRALQSTYMLAQMSILTKCVAYIRNYFVETNRINPRAMVISALRAVENKVAEVIVHVDGENSSRPVLTVVVGDVERAFDLGRVTDLYEMNWKFVDIFEFIERNLSSNIGLKKIEYIAVNGLLRTLDPHSTLLDPVVYGEIRRGTEGTFGGLGVTITLQNNLLTVTAVMRDSPAARSGLRIGDQIVRIEGESTVNMSLREAAERLQGRPGSVVAIWVHRGGWPKERRFPITRSRIRVPSVVAERLEGGILHLALKKFQVNSAAEIRRLLKRQQREPGGLKGLILDMRGNPGGLLDEAVLVSDLFLSKGTIVKTVVFRSQVREERIAHGGEIAEKLPIVVLVDGSSASAAEIVAGALKYNNRAVLIGQPSYGKDTVQVLYEIDEDDEHPSDDRVAALKLTIRRYLLAGSRSIGQTGIQPDIRTDNVSVTQNRVRLSQALRHPLREGQGFDDLDHPVFVYRTFHESPYVDDDAKLALHLLRAAGNVDRRQFLKSSAPLLHELQQRAREKLIAALSRQGVDWTDGKNPASPQIRVELSFEGGTTRLQAGRATHLIARIRNIGRQNLYRLYGVTQSSGDLFDQLDFAFGMVRPGETKQWRIPLNVPRSIEARHERVTLRIYGANHELVATRAIFARLRPASRPRFGYLCQPTDPHGNGDGRIQTGESVVLLCVVQNLGHGGSMRTLATIRNRSGDGVLIRSGLQRISPLAPGGSAIVRFTFDVSRTFTKDEIRLRLRLYDRESDVELSDRLHFTVDRVGREVQKSGMRFARVSSPRVDVFSSADEDGLQLGSLVGGSIVRVDRRVRGWYRVELDATRHGWVAERGLLALQRPSFTLASPQFVPRLRSNPTIELLERYRPPTLTNNAEVVIKGRLRALSDEEQLHDMYVYQNGRKIFFKHARNAAKDGWVYFECPVKLIPGANRLVIVGRQDELLTDALRVSIFRLSRKGSR